MQSTDEMGCDELTDDSGAVDICAHCASENKLQPGLYYCFQCGSFGRYMCGDCNKQHRKYAHGHDVKSIKDAAEQKKQNLDSYERGCDASKDDSGATDICAHCASDSDIRPAVYFCFHCGPYGRYMCEDCNKYHKKFANAHEVRKLLKEAVQKRQEKPKIPPRPRQKPIPAEQTKIKADFAQLTTKSGEAGERISDSGLTDTSDNIQATTTTTAVKERSSNKGNELKTLSALQRDQGNSPNEQNEISNISEIRKQDSNFEDIERQVGEMQIQAAENYRRWKKTLCRSGDFIFVAAIEIDTNYTNYAFSVRSDFSKDPLKISSPKWFDKDGFITTSPPSCILFDKNRELHSFGHDAEDNYSKFAMMDIHKDYYFFRGFKIDKLGLKRGLMLKDEMGKPMRAIDVFSGYIKSLRKHCFDFFQRCIPELADSDIRWVLVVPGNLNDASELLMRDAAEKAGINSQKIRLVLRPEAASIYCQHLPVNSWKGHDDGLRPFAPHYKYLICEAEDFDINVTAHEVMDDGYLKTFYKTSCNNCGDYFIKKAFRDFLASVVGNDVMDEFQATQIMDYNSIFDDLHSKTRSTKNLLTKINFRVPGELYNAFEKARGKSLKDHIKSISQYENKLTLISDMLRIDSALFYGLFMETCDVAARFLQSLINLPQIEHVSTILMVGKFSECAMLQDVIMKKLPNKRFIIPEQPSSAVLNGAVIFGHSID